MEVYLWRRRICNALGDVPLTSPIFHEWLQVGNIHYELLGKGAGSRGDNKIQRERKPARPIDEQTTRYHMGVTYKSHREIGAFADTWERLNGNGKPGSYSLGTSDCQTWARDALNSFLETGVEPPMPRDSIIQRQPLGVTAVGAVVAPLAAPFVPFMRCNEANAYVTVTNRCPYWITIEVFDEHDHLKWAAADSLRLKPGERRELKGKSGLYLSSEAGRCKSFVVKLFNGSAHANCWGGTRVTAGRTYEAHDDGGQPELRWRRP